MIAAPKGKTLLTRLLSSGMRTARLLPVSPSMYGGWVPASGPGGYLPLVWGGGASQHAMGQTPPCEQNHRHVYKHNLDPVEGGNEHSKLRSEIITSRKSEHWYS